MKYWDIHIVDKEVLSRRLLKIKDVTIGDLAYYDRLITEGRLADAEYLVDRLENEYDFMLSGREVSARLDRLQVASDNRTLRNDH